MSDRVPKTPYLAIPQLALLLETLLEADGWAFAGGKAHRPVGSRAH